MTECLQLNLPVSRIGGVAMTFHQGIDLLTSFEPVYAVMDGTAGKAGYYQHSGFYIPLIHSPLFMTSNAHLSDIKVREGAIIMRVGIVNRKLYKKKELHPNINYNVLKMQKII